MLKKLSLVSAFSICVMVYPSISVASDKEGVLLVPMSGDTICIYDRETLELIGCFPADQFPDADQRN